MLVGHVAVSPPFPWRHLLDYFAHRLIPQFERIDNDCYVRQVGSRTIAVAYDAVRSQLHVTANGRVKTEQVLANVARLLDVGHDAQVIQKHLRRSPVLKRRIANVPGMRPLGAWSPFELCVRTILGQQVTVAAAGTLMRRLVERCGTVTPECVADADFAAIGMPGKRVETIRSFARAARDGKVDFARPWPEVEAALGELPGFGPWTRAYLAIRLGRDPDAFPETDLGLIRAAQVDSPVQLLALADGWRPYRAYAATYLWAVAERPRPV
jgi:3-methyladenine DNA glycosylase/8-oxoguanine DNA glycosylase